jgi:hypothetical protein
MAGLNRMMHSPLANAAEQEKVAAVHRDKADPHGWCAMTGETDDVESGNRR